MCLSGCNTVSQARPGAGADAGVPCDAAASPCPNCTPSNVELEVSRNRLTLKHERESRLHIKVEPTSVSVESYRIEIRRRAGGAWCVFSRSQTEDPRRFTMAGEFKLRGVATICGREHVTPEKDVEVQFPDYAQIVGDADVRAAVDTAWGATKADCTEAPNRRREHGFWIHLNTAEDRYEVGATVFGAWSGPGAGAAVSLPARPADNPASPGACDAGATYPVASFHTHTPTTFRAAAVPDGATRPIGPSAGDNAADNTDDVPGVVYDYVESPGGSHSIPMGHPKDSPVQFYHSRGRDRRSTPD